MYDNSFSHPPEPIGEQIRRLRTDKGLSLAALAVAAGTSAPTMHRYENGWDRFELRTLRKIASALGARLEVRMIPAPVPEPSVSRDPHGLLARLRPLFWDHDLMELDLDGHATWVLGRVLMFGDFDQVRAAREYYGDDAIKEAIRRREIDGRTRNYWQLILA